MAVRKLYFVLAFFITLSLLLGIVLVGNSFDRSRQTFINEETQRTYQTLADLQTFSLMAEVYGDNLACIAYRNKLQDFDTSLWNLGLKLDQYRAASEEFRRSSFYEEQKRTFNENEVIYLTLLQNLKQRCDYNQTILMFFYSNSSACPKCDDQSYVLTDINRDIDNEIAIFSFDTNLNITAVNLLSEFYNVTQHPCTIVENRTLCGIRSRDELLENICDYTNVSECESYTSSKSEIP